MRGGYPVESSTFVKIVTVTDPDTGLPVDLEVRKLASGGMVGIDASFLEQMEDTDCELWSPYDEATMIDIPSDEQ